jgi:DNA-binding MarR family transcriptional regulator
MSRQIPSQQQDLDPTTQLISVQIGQVGHALQRRLDHALIEHALSLRRYVALSVIARRPEVSRADLARVLHITPQAVGAVVQRLLAAGFIVRKTPTPGWPLELSVTKAGLDALNTAAPAVQAAEKTALAELPQQTRSALRAVLDHVLETDES